MTAQIRVDSLVKTFGSNVVVDDLNLEIERGEFLVLLGPSGCGKTTTLRCLAGLETPTSGRITLGEQPVFDAKTRVDVSPNHRNIGMVFQSYALWPHMTVRKNIAYPVKVRRLKQAAREDWVGQMAEMVDCGALLDRYPAQLSGGQQQRVALARGLVARPELVLFDEPLSNLDARLRDQVRTEIHRLHERLGFTAVFVTHDQSEALALGDRLAIMRDGRIEQYDTPQRVFTEPVSDYVAAFIGMENQLTLRRREHGWATQTGEPVNVGDADLSGATAVARLRPDDLTVHRSAAEVPDDRVALASTFVTAEYGGRHYDVTVDHGGQRLHLRTDISEAWLADIQEGKSLVASFAPRDARFFDKV